MTTITSTTAYASIKGRSLTVLRCNQAPIVVRKNKRATEFVLRAFRNVKTVVTFGYTWKWIIATAPELESRLSFVNLKEEFRKSFPDAPEKFSRGFMAERLGIEPKAYEPTYPRATGEQTCRLYLAIDDRLLQRRAEQLEVSARSYYPDFGFTSEPDPYRMVDALLS